ncbi:MAG: SRPBCC family protein [Cocleimonas sp.]
MFEISKKIHINASREQLFMTLTSSEEIPKYYPLIEVQSQWELGSEVLYKGEMNGSAFTDYGVIEKLDSPSVYSYSYWSDNHGTERLPENHMAISYQLSESNDGTDLTVIQSNIKSAELYELMKDQVWDFLLGSLKEYVEALT